MRGRRWGGLAITGFLFSGSPLPGQTEASLTTGASVVRYEGFLTSSALVVAPAIRFDSPRLVLAGQGSWTSFESGNSVLEGTAAASWLAGSGGRLRLELTGSGGMSQYAGRDPAAHVLGGARLHLLGGTSGGWAGITTGASGESGAAPLAMAIAGWSARNRWSLVGTATTTLLGPVRFLDLVGAVRWAGPRLELQASTGLRPWASEPGRDIGVVAAAYGEVNAALAVTRWLAVSLSGGKYPADPVRHTLGASYASAGLRLRRAGKGAPPVTLGAGGVLRGRLMPTEPDAPPLEVLGSGDRRILRVHTSNATMIELMGDFTDWVPVRLVRLAPGVWEVELAIPAGVHRVNLRVNGGPWTAPGGTRIEQTEFGGSVGILVVP
ncbi:MAG TPA: hypothetical protein VFU23_09940 [Gemmatimonadales bacterium]|nr:hypothetical protein [Gemmatimonadales bacterium]